MSHRHCQSGYPCRESTVQNFPTSRADHSFSRIYAPHSREHTHYLERYFSQLIFMKLISWNVNGIRAVMKK